MVDAFPTIWCTGCGQLNRLRLDTTKAGTFKCSKCGKPLHSVIAKEGGKNTTRLSAIRKSLPFVAIIAMVGLVIFVGNTVDRPSKNTGSQPAPSVSSATIAKQLPPNAVRELEPSQTPSIKTPPVSQVPHMPSAQSLEIPDSALVKNRSPPSSSPSASAPKSNTLTAAAPVSSPQPSVRDCQDADISCISERNKEIIKRNEYVMSGGEGQMLPLSMIPIPPVQTFDVAKIPKVAYRASPRPPQAAVDTTEKETKPVPPTGDLQPRRSRNAIAPFNIQTKPGSNYLVKLVNVANSKDQIWIFVRGGEPYSTKVPVGHYALRVASGYSWYGREELFGPNTRFFRLRGKRGTSVDGPMVLEFKKGRNRIVGNSLNFESSVDGNMEQEAMTRSEFDAN